MCIDESGRILSTCLLATQCSEHVEPGLTRCPFCMLACQAESGMSGNLDRIGDRICACCKPNTFHTGGRFMHGKDGKNCCAAIGM